MSMSDYIRELRQKVGHDLLVQPAASVAIVDERERVLLCRHSETQNWVMPGGFVEPMEPPADAAVREVWEETGLHVRLTGVVGVFGGPDYSVTYKNGDRVSFVSILFKGEIIGGELRADGEEILEVRFCSSAEIQNLPHLPRLEEMLAGVFDPSLAARFRPSAWKPAAR